MSARPVLWLSVILACAGAVQMAHTRAATNEITLAFPDEPGKYARVLPDYFGGLLKAFDPPPEEPADENAWRARRAQLRRHILHAYGLDLDAPRTPPPVRRSTMLQRDGYRIEKVVIESHDGFLVPTNIYVPDGLSGRAPVILDPHGHWPEGRGKVVDGVQIRCVNQARRGFIAVAHDKIGFGERQFTGHSHEALLLANTCAMGLEVHDIVRILDYLATRGDTDMTRVGMTGCSGGGTQTTFTCAVEDRITAAAPVCATYTYETSLIIGHCPCNYIPGHFELIRYAGLMAMFAPRPLMPVVATRDTCFPIAGPKATLAKLARTYAALGAADRLHLPEFDAEHAYTQAMREAVYGFFMKYLQGRGDGSPSQETPVALEDDRTLDCGGLEGSTTLASYTTARVAHILEAARRMTPTDAAGWQRDADRLREALADRMRLQAAGQTAPSVDRQGPRDLNGFRQEKLVLTTEPGVSITALIVRPVMGGAPVSSPATGNARTCIILLDPEGKTAALRCPLATALVGAGYSVLAIDVRGVGESKPEKPHAWFYAGVHFNRQIAALWTLDVLSAVRYARSLGAFDRVVVVAVGDMGPIGLFAGVAGAAEVGRGDHVDGLAVIGSPVTWRARDVHRLSQPLNVFGLTDLGDLDRFFAAVLPRPVLIVNPRDAGHEPLAPEAARSLLALATAGAAAQTAASGPAGRLDPLTVASVEAGETPSRLLTWLRGQAAAAMAR